MTSPPSVSQSVISCQQPIIQDCVQSGAASHKYWAAGLSCSVGLHVLERWLSRCCSPWIWTGGSRLAKMRLLALCKGKIPAATGECPPAPLAMLGEFDGPEHVWTRYLYQLRPFTACTRHLAFAPGPEPDAGTEARAPSHQTVSVRPEPASNDIGLTRFLATLVLLVPGVVDHKV